MVYDLDKSFEYENGFYATAGVNRMSKFVTHLDLYRKITELRGEVVECGVFKGNSLFRWVKFRELLENTFSRKIIAFDIFGEFPETDFVDDQLKRKQFIAETNGGVSLSDDEIRELLQASCVDKNTELVKGDILQTLKQYISTNPNLKIALLHVDVDIYEATKETLEVLFPHVVRGGVVIFDDYGAFPGANKAIDDYFEGTDIRIKQLPFSNAISYIVKA